MNKIILIFVFISFLIAVIVSLNSKPTFVESTEMSAPRVSAPPMQEIQKNSGKVLAVMPQEYKKEEPKKAESAVPSAFLD